MIIEKRPVWLVRHVESQEIMQHGDGTIWQFDKDFAEREGTDGYEALEATLTIELKS